MARPLRVLEAGGWYHVMSRGNGGQRIFEDVQDYEHCLEILTKGCAAFAVE